ncbi:MAG: Spy/CpxP family protein refolding chaperone [Rhodoferax sp.]|nr:Spy/CpxP family protein refolding chaperone [Rhodoferax sp.]MDP3652224.1 Spy/CpxP family protein refolding chaperone [Rhodoferax sp.]
MKPAFKSLAVAALLACAGFAAFAQNTSPMADHRAMMGDGGMAQHEGKDGRRKMDPAKMEAMVAKHLDALKAKLKITAAQEGAWTTFAAAMKPAPRSVNQYPDRAEMDKLTTPERIDKMHNLRKQHMTDMQTAMDQRDEAIKTFYAALNAEQKKVFDSEHARMGGRHGDDRGPQMPPKADKKAPPATPKQ